MASVVLVLLGVSGAAAAILSLRPTDPIHRLVAAGSDQRDIEPRLSGGFTWAPFERGRSKRHSAALLEAVDDVTKRSSRGHAAALAQILIGDERVAIATLEPLTTTRDAAIFNDLGAAHYVLSMRNDEPARLQAALVAVDEALRWDTSHAEARFNRALIIEALGLRDLAREEWESYLRVDPGSDWSTEARAHVRALAPEPSFEDVVEREYQRLAGDSAAARALARRYRQRTRLWGEGELFGNWGDAIRRKDAAAAEKHLRIARELGSELARDGGDRTLLAFVEGIDRTDPASRPMLAEAHIHLRDGIRAYRDRRLKDAQPFLASAEEKFARGGSSAAFRARYFIAGSLFLQGELAESGRRLQQLAVSSPAGFLGHRGEVRWALASVAVSEGRWGDAIVGLTESLSIYERAGEGNNAATIRQQLVFAYDRIGNRAEAWKLRKYALRELGRELSTRQYEAVVSVTRAAIMDRDWKTAQSFVRLEVDVARHIDMPVLQAESLLYQAEIQGLVGEHEMAVSTLAEARQSIERIPDPSFRKSVAVRANAVEASFTTNSHAAVDLLTEAIEFHSTRGRRMYLPDFHLRRGRAWLKIGDVPRAAADFESGIVELERHRESLTHGENRWGVFHAAQELFGEAIDLALSRGDAQTAFDYSERARARSLFDTVGTKWRTVRASDVPAGTAIVEYALHRQTLFLFVLDDRGVRAFQRPVNRNRLAADIATLTEAGAASDAMKFEKSARALYAELIEPIVAELRRSRTIAFVPDPALARLPFAALVDDAGRFLIELRGVTVEPSAAFFAAARKAPVNETGPVALIVAGDEELGRFRAADREVRAIAAQHRRVVVLESENTTPARFLAEARKAELIHFAGHSVASTAVGDGYLAMRPDAPGDGRLDLKEISSARFPRASAVILAACDTANGDVRSGEGTISVARAFLAAGVPTVVATLWPIEDEASAEFFPLVHRRLASGLSVTEAVRATQIEWIRRGDHSIGLWAAIQVLGQ